MGIDGELTVCEAFHCILWNIYVISYVGCMCTTLYTDYRDVKTTCMFTCVDTVLVLGVYSVLKRNKSMQKIEIRFQNITREILLKMCFVR